MTSTNPDTFGRQRRVLVDDGSTPAAIPSSATSTTVPTAADALLGPGMHRFARSNTVDDDGHHRRSVHVTSQLDSHGFPVDQLLRRRHHATSSSPTAPTRLCRTGATINIVDPGQRPSGQYSSLALDGDVPVISYYDATAANSKLARCADADCTTITRVTVDTDAVADVGQYSSLGSISRVAGHRLLRRDRRRSEAGVLHHVDCGGPQTSVR